MPDERPDANGTHQQQRRPIAVETCTRTDSTNQGWHDRDLELVMRCKADDQDAWRELVDQYRPLAIKFVGIAVRRLGRDEDDAESMANYATLIAVRYFDPQKGASFFTFLTRSMVSQVLHKSESCGPIRVPPGAVKRNRSAVERLRSNERFTRFHELTVAAPTVEAPDERVEWIHDGLLRLRDFYRTVLLMRFSGMRQVDVAQKLGFTRQHISKTEETAMDQLERMVILRRKFGRQQTLV